MELPQCTVDDTELFLVSCRWGEMPTASSSHDGVKRGSFARVWCARPVWLQKTANAAHPWGVLWPYPVSL